MIQKTEEKKMNWKDGDKIDIEFPPGICQNCEIVGFEGRNMEKENFPRMYKMWIPYYYKFEIIEETRFRGLS
jgi:hypothetical protein